MKAPPISEAFWLIAEIAKALGHAPLNATHPDRLCRFAFPGVSGGEWCVAINGTSSPIDGVPPFEARLEWNGWPAGLLNGYGGIIAAGAAANEDTFCEAARAHLEHVRAT